VYLVGDVTIPTGVTVTIRPDTILYFAGYDLQNVGDDPKHCEIIVHGVLDAQATTQNPIIVQHLGLDADQRPRVWDDKVQAIRFHPYQVDTEPLQKEFKSFGDQYFIFWSIVYLMWIIR